MATSDHASDSLAESAFPLYGSEDLVNWQPQVRSIHIYSHGMVTFRGLKVSFLLVGSWGRDLIIITIPPLMLADVLMKTLARNRIQAKFSPLTSYLI